MLHSLQRSSFLRPRERLLELLALRQIDGGLSEDLPTGHDRLADQRTLAAQLQGLLRAGLAEATEREDRLVYTLTATGQKRMRMLTVDLARELDALQDAARALVRGSLVQLAMDGIERVVFYPFGETAEIAHAVVESVGMQVIGIVDDSPRKWGMRFHGLQVQPASALVSLAPDAIVITSAVFQEAILAKLAAMPLDGVRIHVL